MRNWLCLSFVVLSLAIGAPAVADIRVPPEEKESVQVTAPVVIKRGAIRGVDRSVQAKIVIPKHLVHPPGAAAPAAAPAGEEMGAMPANYGTWIAGIALSLAAVSLVFVVRGNRVTKTVAGAVLAGAILLGTYTGLQANAAPPVRAPGSNVAEIVIELVEEGESVTLLLPR